MVKHRAKVAHRLLPLASVPPISFALERLLRQTMLLATDPFCKGGKSGSHNRTFSADNYGLTEHPWSPLFHLSLQIFLLECASFCGVRRTLLRGSKRHWPQHHDYQFGVYCEVRQLHLCCPRPC